MNCNIQKKKGKILGQFTLNAYSDEPALPEISPDDAGKVLAVDENGEIITETIPVPESKKYYTHALGLSITTYGYIECIVITDDNTPFTRRSFAQWLYDNNYRGKLTGFPCGTSPSYVINNNALSDLVSLRVIDEPTTDSPSVYVFGYKRVFTINEGSIKITNLEINEIKAFTLDHDIVNEI